MKCAQKGLSNAVPYSLPFILRSEVHTQNFQLQGRTKVNTPTISTVQMYLLLLLQPLAMIYSQVKNETKQHGSLTSTLRMWCSSPDETSAEVPV